MRAGDRAEWSVIGFSGKHYVIFHPPFVCRAPKRVPDTHFASPPPLTSLLPVYLALSALSIYLRARSNVFFIIISPVVVVVVVTVIGPHWRVSHGNAAAFTMADGGHLAACSSAGINSKW